MTPPSKGKQRAVKNRKESTTKRTDKHASSSSEGALLCAPPWPRREGVPFESDYLQRIKGTKPEDLPRNTRYQSRKVGEAWDDFDSLFYNRFLSVRMEPTKIICPATLDAMGIRQDVERILGKLGFGHIATREYPVYPDLVRQFLASVRLTFANPQYENVASAKLTFFLNGMFYEMSIEDLCKVYGFDSRRQGAHFPEDFPNQQNLWNHIASGTFKSRAAKQALIRNPAIRVVAKVISNILFAKMEPNAVRSDELILLHHGIGEHLSGIYQHLFPAPNDMNLGLIFARVLVAKKIQFLGNQLQKENIGSLLTPLFIHHGIDLTRHECIEKVSYIDKKHLHACRILKHGYIYEFTDRERRIQHCLLPQPDLTEVNGPANIEFLPPPERLCTDAAAAPRRRGRTYRAPQYSSEDEPVADFFAEQEHGQTSQPRDPIEMLLPEYSGEYDLPPLSADASEGEYRAWMVKSQEKNNGMLKRIWGALAKIRCPRPPPCFRAEPTTNIDRTEGNAPVFVPHRTPTSSDTEELSNPEERLQRRRRQRGQSRSVSPAHPHH